MHKNYREPIKIKYLVIAIIGVVIFAAVLSFFTLRTSNKSTSSQTKPKVEYTQLKKIWIKNSTVMARLPQLNKRTISMIRMARIHIQSF
jgi:hypothetical protein